MKKSSVSVRIAVLLFLFSSGTHSIAGGEFTVAPENCRIIHASGKLNSESAKDLQLHLKLITGRKIPVTEGRTPEKGAFSFCVGIRPANDHRPFQGEESRWSLTENAAYFYGNDAGEKRGTEFAVYCFLERQLGVRWVEPGDGGIAFRKQYPLVLKTGEFSWIPALKIRSLRCWTQRKNAVSGLEAFHHSPAEMAKIAGETRVWQYRMRMCFRTDELQFGHAFTDWWSKYGTVHPDYFAVNKTGKRAPLLSAKQSENPVAVENSAKTIKLCVSNPAVADEIVRNYLAESPRRTCINVCENDNVGGYCRCAACLALDANRKYPMDDYRVCLTDRYLHLANEVAKRSAEHGSPAVTMYVYNQTIEPPVKEKVHPNVVLGMVPNIMDPEHLTVWYDAWKKAGATRLTFRPNHHWCFLHTALPMGLEKRFFDVFQLAVRKGAVGADFDSSQGQWSISGMTDYILAGAMAEPGKSFEELEEEYCSAFGAAAPEVRDYFRYWRNQVFEKRLRPRFDELVETGRFYNFARGVLWKLKELYRLEDFDGTDAMLRKGLAKKLSPPEKQRLERLMLANTGARLLFLAVTSPKEARVAACVNLLNFRLQNRANLHMDFNRLWDTENAAGVTELASAILLKDFGENAKETPRYWYFRTDEKDAGRRENWPLRSIRKIRSEWDAVPTDCSWENAAANDSSIPEELGRKLKNYDGIGWYAVSLTIPDAWRQKKIFLCFGAVDESCEVYLNGRKAGGHEFRRPNDWNTPFSVEITPYIRWDQKEQTVFVRVVDTAGNGGIWKRVWLTAGNK